MPKTLYAQDATALYADLRAAGVGGAVEVPSIIPAFHVPTYLWVTMMTEIFLSADIVFCGVRVGYLSFVNNAEGLGVDYQQYLTKTMEPV